MVSTRARFVVAVGLFGAISVVAAAALVNHPGPENATPTATTRAITLAASSTSNTITVVGQGSAVATPDEALVNLGVSATRPTVRDAVASASLDMSRLMGAMHAQGVQDKDIQTISLSIYQQNNCCPQQVTSYNASNQVVVTVHHLVNVSPLIEAAADAVGNDIQLGGVSLIVSDPSTQVRAARAAAMADANARVQAWAGLAGHRVGGLVSLSETVNAPPSMPCNGCGGAGGGPFQVQPGQTTVSITITAVYELLG